MRKIFSLTFVLVLLLATVAQANELMLSCRFTGQEELYMALEIFQAEIFETDKVPTTIKLTLKEGGRTESAEFAIKEVTGEGNENLEHLLKSLKQNHGWSETGEGYFGKKGGQILLKVETEPFETAQKAKSMRAFQILEDDNWYIDIEVFYVFYNDKGKIITAWAYSRFSQIYNYCIPQEETAEKE